MVAGSLDIILVRATSEEEAVVDFTIPPLLKDLNRQLEALAIASANYSLLKVCVDQHLFSPAFHSTIPDVTFSTVGELLLLLLHSSGTHDRSS